MLDPAARDLIAALTSLGMDLLLDSKKNSFYNRGDANLVYLTAFPSI